MKHEQYLGDEQTTYFTPEIAFELPPPYLETRLRLLLAIARAEAEGNPRLAAAFAEMLKRQMEGRRG